jgi:aspartyl-tRNA synthetase
MLTSIQNPIIEAYKLRLDCGPREVQDFIHEFMDSPDAEPFTSNVDGAPGICVYDSRKPVEGLQTFGFEGAEKLKKKNSTLPRPEYQDEETHQINTTFEDGDLLVVQARENLPQSGGSTVLGKLRLAIHKAAVARGLIKPDPAHHYLWVTKFPMFTMNNSTGPGQGGASGFSATHHPFTAPMSAEDVDLLLIDPLKAKADHYDLVVNGVELGGGSRRIHNAEMQKFVMRDILKVFKPHQNLTRYQLTSPDERRTLKRLLPPLPSSRSRLSPTRRFRHRVRPPYRRDD